MGVKEAYKRIDTMCDEAYADWREGHKVDRYEEGRADSLSEVLSVLEQECPAVKETCK